MEEIQATQEHSSLTQHVLGRIGRAATSVKGAYWNATLDGEPVAIRSIATTTTIPLPPLPERTQQARDNAPAAARYLSELRETERQAAEDSGR